MRVVQLLPTISYGDAVGNDTLALRDLLVSMGYETQIYAEGIDPRVAKQHSVIPADELPDFDKDDVLIYHLSIGSSLHNILPKLKCKKIAIYHNVTPAEFFTEYNPILFDACTRGIEEVKQLNDVFDYCLAVSDFNRRDLLSYGYKCKIDVRPVLIPFDDYEKTPNRDVIDKYSDGRTNIIFVGRVVSNKKQEDVIAAFSCYKKNYDPDARLFLVGSNEGNDVYQRRLNEFIEKLDLEDVYFTGKIAFDEILAYYKIANIFLCMSEHEGFCVPIIEAMYFDVPIIAYAGAAIPDTLGGAGVLLQEKNPLITAGVINKVITDARLRDKIISEQKKRVENFYYKNTSELFRHYLTEFMKGDTSH
jgi:glycosyltransferase involved in cell wall biosynthesis